MLKPAGVNLDIANLNNTDLKWKISGYHVFKGFTITT